MVFWTVANGTLPAWRMLTVTKCCWHWPASRGEKVVRAERHPPWCTAAWHFFGNIFKRSTAPLRPQQSAALPQLFSGQFAMPGWGGAGLAQQWALSGNLNLRHLAGGNPVVIRHSCRRVDQILTDGLISKNLTLSAWDLLRFYFLASFVSNWGSSKKKQKTANKRIAFSGTECVMPLLRSSKESSAASL